MAFYVVCEIERSYKEKYFRNNCRDANLKTHEQGSCTNAIKWLQRKSVTSGVKEYQRKWEGNRKLDSGESEEGGDYQMGCICKKVKSLTWKYLALWHCGSLMSIHWRTSNDWHVALHWWGMGRNKWRWRKLNLWSSWVITGEELRADRRFAIITLYEWHILYSQ